MACVGLVSVGGGRVAGTDRRETFMSMDDLAGRADKIRTGIAYASSGRFQPHLAVAGLIDLALGGGKISAVVIQGDLSEKNGSVDATVAVFGDSLVAVARVTAASMNDSQMSHKGGPVSVQVVPRSSLTGLEVAIDGYTQAGSRSDLSLGRISFHSTILAKFTGLSEPVVIPVNQIGEGQALELYTALLDDLRRSV